jgi:hypothetical protein
MERQMVESRVFDRVQKKWDPPDAKGSTGFTLSAVVARPTFRPSYAADQDFARRTLSDRRYGPQKPEEPTPEPEEPRASTAAPAAADLPPSGDLETPSSAVTLANSTPAAEPAAADTATEERSDASTTKGMRRAVPSGTSGGLARRSERTPGSSDATVPVPPPITDEQIAAMTRSEASEAASRVAKARREASVDAATQARLKSEFEKLMLRSRSNP